MFTRTPSGREIQVPVSGSNVFAQAEDPYANQPMSPAQRIRADIGNRSAPSAPPPAYALPEGIMPPPPVAFPSQKQKCQTMTLAQRVDMVSNKLDLDAELADDLVRWAGTEVIVIADDSGSMSNIADYQKRLTRWDELKMRLSQLLDILLLVDDDGGFELKFLNKGHAAQIRCREDLDAVWRWATPAGRTPLGEVMGPYLNPRGLENDRLLMVMTDGLPSDVNFDQLRSMIQRKNKKVFVSVMMCTDEDDVVEKYNRQVDPIPGVDVLDDYESERAEVEKFRGKKLSVNTYLVKCILGPKFIKYDNLDENPSCHCSIS